MSIAIKCSICNKTKCEDINSRNYKIKVCYECGISLLTHKYKSCKYQHKHCSITISNISSEGWVNCSRYLKEEEEEIKMNTCLLCKTEKVDSMKQDYCDNCCENNILCSFCSKRNSCDHEEWYFDHKKDLFSCNKYSIFNKVEKRFTLKGIKKEMEDYLSTCSKIPDANEDTVFHLDRASLQRFLNKLIPEVVRKEVNITANDLTQAQNMLDTLINNEKNEKETYKLQWVLGKKDVV